MSQRHKNRFFEKIPGAFSCILFLYLIFIFSSCKKETPPPPDLGYGYSPNNIGHWVIYQVDSNTKDDPIGLDTIYQFQVKEVIQSIYTDNSGRPAMRLERFRKNYNPLVPYSQQQWTGPRIYSANLTSTTYERVEENFRYTRAVFPVTLSQRWNPNANNTLQAWTGKYTSIDQPDNINSLNFDSVATVEEVNSINLVESKYVQAKYAKHVGLVYRRFILLSKQGPGFQDTVALTNPGSYLLLSPHAIIFTQKIVAWGD